MPSAKYHVTLVECPNQETIMCGNPDKCDTCGWNQKENERRKHLREAYGLTKGSDGLKRLVIREKGNMKIDAHKIKLTMAEMEMNQTMLAEKMGVTRQVVSAILGRGSCSIGNCGKIAKALLMPVSEIIIKE